MAAENLWKSIDETTWQYDDGGVRFFLLAGSERAMLIDSGMTVRDVIGLARQATDLPLILFNTHADMDHMGGAEQFDQFYMNPAETVNFRRPLSSRWLIPVYDGDVIDLGNRPLTAVALPGHTPGSTALLDENTGRLFSGDPVQKDGRIFMFGPMRSLPAYIHSLRRLEAMEGRFTEIYPSHAACPISPEVIGQLRAGAERLEAGQCAYDIAEFHGTRVRVYDIGPSKLLRDDK